jgi:hypothetical protein
MNTTRRYAKTPADYRVCHGKLFVNEEYVPVNHRVLKIGLTAAGLSGAEPCEPISEEAARRILHMERAFLLAGLTAELRGGNPGRAA